MIGRFFFAISNGLEAPADTAVPARSTESPLPCSRPPVHWHCYRSPSSLYQVCWPAFSSASATRTVAEDFVKGDEGTLFFLQSTAARAISRFSKFPDEDEVIFRPNTVFEITSTLYGHSEIGEFYASVDNIAMVELTSAADAAAGPDPNAPEVTYIGMTLNTRLSYALLNLLANSPVAIVESLETRNDPQGGLAARLTLRSNPEYYFQELPQPEEIRMLSEAGLAALALDLPEVLSEGGSEDTEGAPPNSPELPCDNSLEPSWIRVVPSWIRVLPDPVSVVSAISLSRNPLKLPPQTPEARFQDLQDEIGWDSEWPVPEPVPEAASVAGSRAAGDVLATARETATAEPKGAGTMNAAVEGPPNDESKAQHQPEDEEPWGVWNGLPSSTDASNGWPPDGHVRQGPAHFRQPSQQDEDLVQVDLDKADAIPDPTRSPDSFFASVCIDILSPQPSPDSLSIPSPMARHVSGPSGV